MQSGGLKSNNGAAEKRQRDQRKRYGVAMSAVRIQDLCARDYCAAQENIAGVKTDLNRGKVSNRKTQYPNTANGPRKCPAPN
jgi:hypothetical protein